jgi:PPM family protein phosphatase
VSIFQTVLLVEGDQSNIEDRAAVVEMDHGCVIVVADGAGGSGGAALAAELVVQMVQDQVPGMTNLLDDLAWCNLLTRIDQAMVSSHDRGQSTGVIAAVTANGISGASVGDSSAWLVLPESAFELTGQQIAKPLLGTGRALPVPFSARLDDGKLLVATDGLMKYANVQNLIHIVRSAPIDEAAERLVKIVRLPSGELWDDTTVVLCRMEA